MCPPSILFRNTWNLRLSPQNPHGYLLPALQRRLRNLFFGTLVPACISGSVHPDGGVTGYCWSFGAVGTWSNRPVFPLHMWIMPVAIAAGNAAYGKSVLMGCDQFGASF